MFKFKCASTFTNENVIDENKYIQRDYAIPNNTNSSPKISSTDVKPPKSALASYSDYLFDDYTADRDNKLRGKNIIDFPEIEDANSCLTTNDGLVIFNYDSYCIVYDLVYDNNMIFDEISDDDSVDIRNHIDLIKYCKYTSPRVHCLDIVDGKVKPDIKFKDSAGTYHFFVDCDLDTDTYPLDEYGYYTSSNINDDTTFDIIFNHRSNLIVSTNRFIIIDESIGTFRIAIQHDGYWWTRSDGIDGRKILFEHIEIEDGKEKKIPTTGTVYVCC